MGMKNAKGTSFRLSFHPLRMRVPSVLMNYLFIMNVVGLCLPTSKIFIQSMFGDMYRSFNDMYGVFGDLYAYGSCW